MAKFYVGKRVRIKYSDNWPELSGQEGVIVGKPINGGMRGISEWRVSPDTWGSFVAPRMGKFGATKFAPNSCQIEPLTPPHEACDPEFAESIRRLTDSVSA